MGIRPFYFGKGFKILPYRLVAPRSIVRKWTSAAASNETTRAATAPSSSDGKQNEETLESNTKRVKTDQGRNDDGNLHSKEAQTLMDLPDPILGTVLEYAAACPMDLFRFSTVNHKFFKVAVAIGGKDCDQKFAKKLNSNRDEEIMLPLFYQVDRGTSGVLSRVLWDSSTTSTAGWKRVSHFGLDGEFATKDTEGEEKEDLEPEVQECILQLEQLWERPKHKRYLEKARAVEASLTKPQPRPRIFKTRGLANATNTESVENSEDWRLPISRVPDFHRLRGSTILGYCRWGAHCNLFANGEDSSDLGLSLPSWLVYVTNRILRPRGYYAEGELGVDDDSAGSVEGQLGGYGIIEMRQGCLVMHLSEECQSPLFNEPGLLEYLSASGLVPLYPCYGPIRERTFIAGGWEERRAQGKLVVDVPDYTRDFIQDAWYDRNDLYSSRLLKLRFCETYEARVRQGLGLERWLEYTQKQKEKQQQAPVGKTNAES
jgi:hypothetical protein